MKSFYKIYRDRLIQISGRSRSLYSNKISKKQTYNLGALFDNDGDGAKEFIDFLFGNGGRYFKLFNDNQIKSFFKDSSRHFNPDERQAAAIENEKKDITLIKREAEEFERETGRYELFVGYPFAEGALNNELKVKAPLLLFPVRVRVHEKDIELELIKEEPVTLNKVFILACAREFRINADDFNYEFEDFGRQFSSLSNFFNYMKKLDLPIKYAINKKAVLDFEAGKNDKLKNSLEIKNYCVLGRYPLANSIYQDYNVLEKKRLTAPAIEALLNTKEIKNKNKKPEDYFPVFQLDYAQENAILEINNRQNVVIYGPPGTGKSQTIVNIICDNIIKNKNVLVISQKKAALDVVYNRLGHLNQKAALITDPEKAKQEFYTRLQLRHNEITGYKNTYDAAKYKKTEAELNKDIAELEQISKAMFTVTPFGITLQKMYLLCGNIGKNTMDYQLYQAMLKSNLMNYDYPRINKAVKSIAEKNLGNIYYNRLLLKEKNPLIDYIKTDLDLHKINTVRAYINKILSKDFALFNISDYEYSRFLLAYNLEGTKNPSLQPLADMVTKISYPKLNRSVKATAYFPLFWPAYPFVKSNFTNKKQAVTKKLIAAQSAITRYIGEFELISEVIEQKGLAMIIDSIVYGNVKMLNKLLAALDDYASVKDMKIFLGALTGDEKEILEFAYNNSKNKTDFLTVLAKVKPIRVYHEVITEEKKKEAELSKIIIFDDLKKRILKLKKDQNKLLYDLAADKFNAEYNEHVKKNSALTKDYLHQIMKQSKPWPIRRLTEYFSGYLFKIFPCWLLTPEAASSILPLTPGLFDLVIFDEASQIFIENSIPAVYRAKSVVVAGDNKQLRPTSLFVKRYMGGEDAYSPDLELNEQTLIEVESLLDLAASRLKPAHLTYHYRSKYEELINFSNYAFYENRLNVAPNISKAKNILPIERIMTDGVWKDRTNVKEARIAAELVKKILSSRKNKETIGIVTFNAEQQELIEDKLDELCSKDPAFRKLYLAEKNRVENGEDISLFVKNLENVQGDERDIIIFSIAYAKNELGKLNAQFGILGLAGGENRLNVAITRAKTKVYVITSVEPEEFSDIGSAKNAGPKLLIKYLQYARAVSSRDKKQAQTILDSLLVTKKADGFESGRFEEALKAELIKLGYTVDTNLGSADYRIPLAVYDKDSERYLLGLECDYAAYAASENTLERDVYKSRFLEARGWRIMRVWSRDWWQSKNALLKNIEKEIEQSKIFYTGTKTAAKAPQPSETVLK